MFKILIVLIIVIANVRAFWMFGDDKQRAVLGLWRIPEEELMLAAMLGGIGAYAGMQTFHHKTVKGSFPVLVPVLAVIQLVLLGLFAVILF